MKDLLDSDLLWIASKARYDAIYNGDSRSRRLERDAVSELETRYPGDTVLGALIRERKLHDAYVQYADSLDKEVKG